MDKNILVVEDDAQVREGVRDILEANGYTVYEAFNEKTAMIHLMSENMQTVTAACFLFIKVYYR